MVSKTNVSEESKLFLLMKEMDYVDSYKIKVENSNLKIDSVVISFFHIVPRWVKILMSTRNALVKVFGLKTDKEEQIENADSYEFKVGDNVGLFECKFKNENEIILGADDKHLDFRISFFMEEIQNTKGKEISISTTVKTHNIFGKIYFGIIKPFHHIIVKTMIKRMKKNLE